MNTEQTSQNIFTYKYTYNKKYTYISNPVFVFVVILSSSIMYAKLESISECRQSSHDNCMWSRDGESVVIWWCHSWGYLHPGRDQYIVAGTSSSSTSNLPAVGVKHPKKRWWQAESLSSLFQRKGQIQWKISRQNVRQSHLDYWGDCERLQETVMYEVPKWQMWHGEQLQIPPCMRLSHA